MLPENAAALVGAGVLSVLLFPIAAVSLARRVDGSSDLDEPTAPTRQAE